MDQFIKELQKGYEKYVASRLGLEKASGPFYDLDKVCKAAQELSGQYDLGIELATDGLFFGYIFGLHGLPVKTVKVKRHGIGAKYEEISPITEEDVKDKKVLFFDVDAITGRSLKRVTKEIARLKPEYMDAIFMMESSMLSVRSYKEMRKKRTFDIPQFEIAEGCKLIGVKETPEGIEVTYLPYGREEPKTQKKANKDYVSFDIRHNIPSSIKRVITLGDYCIDFRDDTKHIRNLEKLLSEK